MPRPVRYVRNTHYYFLTNRCLLGQFVMLPDDECTRIIKGCLTRAAQAHNVELVCFVFLSNHFHIVARFPDRNMGEFMCQLQGQIADRLNDHRVRSAPVFPERYDDQALLDDQTLRDKISYVLNNPVQDRLVGSAEDWPGVTSMRHHYEGDATVDGEWLDHAAWRNDRRTQGEADRSDAMVEHTVDLHYPAALAGESPEERRQSLIELVEEERDRLHRLWGVASGGGPSVLGADAILEEFHWSDRPDEPPDSERRYLGVASSADRMRDYHRKRRRISRDYRRASSRWPDCIWEDFPEGTYPPGSTHCVGSPGCG